jgi:small-conductance mechanosensitive channel
MNPGPSFWDQMILGNRAGNWLASVIILVVVLALLRILRSILVRHLGRLARRTQTQVDDLLVELLGRTRSFLLFFIAVYVGSFALHLPEAHLHVIRTLAVIALLLQSALWGNHLITFGLSRYLQSMKGEDASTLTTVSTLGFVGRLVLWSILLLLALDNLGIKVTGLITGLGIGGVAVAMAAQQVLKDLFASLAIALDKPFLIGDAIKVDEFTGRVEHIGIKTTRLRSVTGEELIFSNSNLLESRIRNFKRMEERFVLVTIPVVYQTPPEKLEAVPGILRTAVEGIAHARFERAHLKTLGDSAAVFEMGYTIESGDFRIYMDARSAINLLILRGLQAGGIRLAYPTQTVNLAGTPEEIHLPGQS